MNWNPPDDWTRITSIDCHAAGEPLRELLGRCCRGRCIVDSGKRSLMYRLPSDVRHGFSYPTRVAGPVMDGGGACENPTHTADSHLAHAAVAGAAHAFACAVLPTSA